jgi:peptidoglycan/LPS O-acetylase OafA/YrhL
MHAKRLSRSELAIACALGALMAATRFHHFGSALQLPDASLAVFFLGGLYLRRTLAFGAYAGLGALVDYMTIAHVGVSDWCVTPAYAFLLPTYACLWWAGVWCAKHERRDWRRYPRLAGALLVATVFAFLISNASFYGLSNYFGELSLAEYAARVARYFPPYLASTVAYVTAAMALEAGMALAARTGWARH